MITRPDPTTVPTNEILDVQVQMLDEIRNAVRTIRSWIIFWSLMSILIGAVAAFAMMAAASST